MHMHESPEIINTYILLLIINIENVILVIINNKLKKNMIAQ